MSNDKLRFTTSTKGEPNTDTLMTSSTATTTPHRSNSDPVPGGKFHEEGDADDGVVFHMAIVQTAINVHVCIGGMEAYQRMAGCISIKKLCPLRGY